MDVNSKKFLTRDLILGVLDLPTKDVEVPEWGGVVKIRAMTGMERDVFESAMVTEEGERRGEKFKNIRARLCSIVIVGEDGKTPLFSESDINMLGTKSAKALNRVFEAARELSGFTKEDVKELEGK